MSNELLFALTFVTIVILTTILYLRLSKYETYLREEQRGVERLNERLQMLAESFESLGTKRIEGQLGDIHQTLEAIHDDLQRGSGGFGATGGDGVVMPAAPPRGSFVDIVEAKLYNLGYGRVVIVTDLSDVDSSQPTRVVVEAERGGVVHKGHLTVHGSTVTELDLQPSYTSFP